MTAHDDRTPEITPERLTLTEAALPRTYVGALGTYALGAPRSRLWRLMHRKTWYYGFAADAELGVGFSLLQTGYAMKAFVYAAERAGGRMLFVDSLTLPRGPWAWVVPLHGAPGQPLATARGMEARLALARGIRARLALARGAEGDFVFDYRGARAALTLRFTPAPPAPAPPLVAATRLAGGDVNLTTKIPRLCASGEIRAAGARRTLGDASGGIDFTDGFLPRHTRWRWAFFDGRAQSGRPVTLNLVQGFNGAPECMAWHGDEVVALGEARFDFGDVMGGDVMEPWQITTTCGRVRLTFTPFALHREDTNLGFARAAFKQPVGVFSGTLDLGAQVEIDDVIGVCEDQDVVW